MYHFEKIGALNVIDIPGTRPGGYNVVMLHGYGADANDLAPLSHVLKTPDHTRWLLPNGPLIVPIGPGMSGHGWAPINMEEWQRAMLEKRPRDLSKDRPAELFSSKKAVLEMMDAAKIDFEKTIFAGFSQGAMLASHLALTHPTKKPLGLMIFSGSLINAQDLLENSPKHKGFKYFQCHGEQDEILHISGAQNLFNLLQKCGLDGQFKTFQGGHDIPTIVEEWAQDYLYKVFPKESWQETE